MQDATNGCSRAARPRPHVACYYFPNYHEDPRNAAHHGKGWSEWELVRRAEPRFPGHRQPRVPLHGEEDEADPRVMASKIDLAADHGIDTFLFDWYYYDDGPFLQRALDEGFLHAPNRDRMTFALMWANHDWVDIHPAKALAPSPVLYPGTVTPRTFERIVDHVIGDYFLQPNYWKPGGRPYFSIYDVGRFVRSFGSLHGAQAGLELFRDRVRDAGLDDLHLDLVMWGPNQILRGEEQLKQPGDVVRALGADSVASYVWIHHIPFDGFPTMPYRRMMEKSMAYWHEAQASYSVPYYPNVTVGWDSSPRTVQSDHYAPHGYPWATVLNDANPTDFGEAVARCAEFLARRDDPAERIMTINAWNEWTEGSYMEPDTEHGLAYLQALREGLGQFDLSAKGVPAKVLTATGEPHDPHARHRE